MRVTMTQVPSSMRIPLEPLLVLAALHKAGFVGYLVGGAVRDTIRSARDQNETATLEQTDTEVLLSTDYDITTNARPQDVLNIFPEAFYENAFGTVSLTYQHVWSQFAIDEHYQQARQLVQQPVVRKENPRLIDLARATKIHQSLLTQSDESVAHTSQESAPKPLPLLEITTFRSGEEYADKTHQPTAMRWGGSLLEDLQRRDFTINALALKLDTAFLTQFLSNLDQTAPMLRGYLLAATDFSIIDRHQGLNDLDAHLIRTVGEPTQRFIEDALRMVRAVRFAAQLGFAIEPSTQVAIAQHAAALAQISWERIGAELMKLIGSPNPKLGIELLDQTNLLPILMPELLAMKGVAQGGHHTTDVWTHSLDALAACPSSDPVVRLATLLHDISKPETYKLIDGQPTFYNHEILGARVAKRIAQRLRLTKADCDRVFTLVRYHMFHYQPENTDASIRRFMRKVGLENIDDILDLREGDRLGSGARKTSWRLEEMKERMVEQLHQPLDVTDLAINGHDLMQELNLKPGPQIGELLNYLFEQVLEQPELNDPTALIDLAKKYPQ